MWTDDFVRWWCLRCGKAALPDSNQSFRRSTSTTRLKIPPPALIALKERFDMHIRLIRLFTIYVFKGRNVISDIKS